VQLEKNVVEAEGINAYSTCESSPSGCSSIWLNFPISVTTLHHLFPRLTVSVVGVTPLYELTQIPPALGACMVGINSVEASELAPSQEELAMEALYQNARIGSGSGWVMPENELYQQTALL
jgi:hypothetical protein